MKTAPYKTQVFTGIRPSANLTLGNALGAVYPLLELQKQGKNTIVFVADLHGLTDKEPETVRDNIREVVTDYIALGLDPEQIPIFVQSDIKHQVALLTIYLARLASVAELMRIPTLKDKLKDVEHPENANALLANYPIMMAADILLQGSEFVPVGDDQVPHIEFTRKLARRFNKAYGETLPLPKAQMVKPLRIMGLKGKGKMSKSVPSGAIFLTDSPEEAKAKIKRAETAIEGEMTDVLASHFLLARGLTDDAQRLAELDQIEKDHMAGQKVMGNFKALFGEIVADFLVGFQAKRAEVVSDPDYIDAVLERGSKLANENAQSILDQVETAMYG